MVYRAYGAPHASFRQRQALTETPIPPLERSRFRVQGAAPPGHELNLRTGVGADHLARRLQVKHFERRNFGERKASGWLNVSGTALAGFTRACWKSSWRAPLPDWQINELRHSFGLPNSAPSSLRYDNPALGAAWRQRQANMHRQSMWHSVFRLDCPAHGLDIAACDR